MTGGFLPRPRARTTAARTKALAAVLATVAALSGAGPLAAQWIEPPGKGWVQASLYHHDTRDEFGLDGERRGIRNDGHAIATSLFTTVAVGIVKGVDAWVQIPFHRIEYSDISPVRVRSGIGDVRGFLRVSPTALLGSDFPLAVRGGAKLSVGDFPLDAEIIPLGEGQTDWELMAEVGHSFWPRSVYVMGWVGYRWREANVERRIDFGDEAFFFAAVGGSLGRANYKLSLEGWDGAAPVLEGIKLENASREMLQITPSLGTTAGPGQVDVGARIPLAGRNLTAGPAWTVGYFLRFGN